MRAFALRWLCLLSPPFLFLVTSQTTLRASESSKTSDYARFSVAAKPSPSAASKAMPMPLVVPLFVRTSRAPWSWSTGQIYRPSPT